MVCQWASSLGPMEFNPLVHDFFVVLLKLPWAPRVDFLPQILPELFLSGDLILPSEKCYLKANSTRRSSTLQINLELWTSTKMDRFNYKNQTLVERLPAGESRGTSPNSHLALRKWTKYVFWRVFVCNVCTWMGNNGTEVRELTY